MKKINIFSGVIIFIFLLNYIFSPTDYSNFGTIGLFVAFCVAFYALSLNIKNENILYENQALKSRRIEIFMGFIASFAPLVIGIFLVSVSSSYWNMIPQIMIMGVAMNGMFLLLFSRKNYNKLGIFYGLMTFDVLALLSLSLIIFIGLNWPH